MKFTIDPTTGNLRPLPNQANIDVEVEESTDVAGSNKLGVPTNVHVFEQKVIVSRGGQQAVDVVLAFDEVPGIEEYEVRVTR